MKYRLLAYSVFICFTGFAQINEMKPMELGVNWDKTVHLLFPTDIKYFSTVSNYIVADRVGHILSIKANEEDYTGTSSLTVATADGQFYTFSIIYVADLHQTTHRIGGGIHIPQKLYINSKNEIHLLFPDEVTYIDYGSDVISAYPTADLQNIVKIATAEPFEYITNVSVATADNTFYSFDIEYNEQETNFTYFVGETVPETPALLNKEDLTDITKQQITERLNSKGRSIHTLGLVKNKVVFSIHNIFVMNDKLLFRIELQNNSNIKYDIDYIKFYIVDRKKNKKTASQEIETFPLFIENFTPLVEGKDKNIFSVCFEKFTIPDNKFFAIEINEKNGGRHLYFKLTNKDIIDAEVF